MKKYNHLLIDGRNTLYRAVYAGIGDRSFQQSGADYFVIFIRFIHYYFKMFTPKSVHIFWDPHKNDVWRKSIYPQYKANRNNGSEIDTIIKKQFIIAMDICSSMGIHQYYKNNQEADDLIYAFCRTIHEPSIIISSDSDLIQIPYSMNHVDVYNPGKKQLEPMPTYDPVKAKALIGDKADNIKGYYKIGPIKGKYLAQHHEELNAFIKDKALINEETSKTHDPSGNLFKINRLLIDLGLCPHLLDNMVYVENKISSKLKYNHKEIINKLKSRNVNGVIEESDKYIVPFLKLNKHEISDENL